MRFPARPLDQALAVVAASMGGSNKSLQPLRRRPSVSVVIPCYNYGHYLERCIASAVERQDGVEVEVIVVDDKSVDNSFTIACAIAKRRPEVRVIAHAVNQGAIATYNHGLSQVTGEYVVLLSADDLLAPGALPRAARVMEMAPNVGLVYGAAQDFEADPPPPRHGSGRWILWSGQQWLRIRCRSGYNVVASPEVVMRTATLRKIGPYRPDLPHTGDFEMWLRAAAVADVGFLVAADQAYYRKHATNMHKTTFKSGTHEGALIDLEQRWQAFESALGTSGSAETHHSSLLNTARATIARHALQYTNYAYARGFRSFPVQAYESLAMRIRPDVGSTAEGRALMRRKRFGMLPGMPLHPLWAAAALYLRATEIGRRLRRHALGV